MSEANVLQYDPVVPGASALARVMDWFKGHERRVLIVAVALQAAVLLSMIAIHAATLTFGETVFVRVVPVDPRDLFRGDYVVLSYEFSQIPPAGVEGLPSSGTYDNWSNLAGRTVYVTLVPEGDGRHFKAGAASVNKPDDGLFLQGRIAGWNRIEYGIEAFYLQEGRGLEYERAVQNGRLSAELAVLPGGKAALKGLHIAETPAPQTGTNASSVPGTVTTEP